MRSIPLLAAAEEELAEAARHYETEAAGLAEVFLGEFERALDRIVTFSSHGTPYLAGTRRVVLQRFRFQIVYTVEEDQILVVAVAHQRRSPGYWRNRL